MVRSSSSERFTPKAISMICSHAKGIPRIINILCDNAFQMGHSLSRKKIDVDIIREVIKDREGPFLQNTFLSGISSAVTAVKEFRLFSPRLNSLFSKAFLIVLSSLCLGGFVFLIDRYFQPRPAKTWDIKSIKSPSVNIQPSLGPPSSQNLTGEISGSNTSQLSVEPKPISPEFPKPASPPNAPLTPMSEEDQSMKIVTIKRGQTIYSLTKECYRMVNRTLMDFILDLNPEVTDVHLILVDQKIMIPTVTEKLLVIKSADNTYKIHAGTFPTPGAARLYTDERALKGKKVETFSRKVSPRDTWFRVVIGKFESEAEVLGMIGLLKEKGLLPAFGGPLKIE
jgi:general secretion pathway protein A